MTEVVGTVILGFLVFMCVECCFVCVCVCLCLNACVCVVVFLCFTDLAVLDQLRVLEDFLWDEYSNRGANPEKLYEKAQRAGNIVPRLYLLITVGGIFIRSKQAAARAILRDLAEMCKGTDFSYGGG